MDKWALDRPVGGMPLGEFKELLKEAVAEARKQIAEGKVHRLEDVIERLGLKEGAIVCD